MQFMNTYMSVSLWLCKAYPNRSDLARNLRYSHCLEDEKESSRFSDVSQSMLCLSVLIAAGSFAAAFTPPGDYITKGENASMALFYRKSPFLLYVEANSMSFCFSTIATCLLIHASLPTTPRRHRRNYLQVSAVLVSGAVLFMFTTFTSVVQLTLDPQKSWRDCLFVYFPLVVEQLMVYIWILLPFSVLAIPACFRVSMRLRMSKHPWRDMLRVLAVVSLPTCGVYCLITDVISAIKIVQSGKQESCTWLRCHDAIFLHPT